MLCQKVLEAESSSVADLATEILTGGAFCALFSEEAVIIDTLECENFE